MANLIPCPSCGHMISAQATLCPSCGDPLRTAPAPMGRRNTIILAVVVVLTLLVFLSALSFRELAEAQKRANAIQAEFDAIAGRMGVVPSSEPAQRSE